MLLILGRALYGVGCESMFVTQAVFTTAWFQDSEISLAMGISASFPMLVSFSSGIIYPRIYKHHDLETAFFLGSVVCIFSLIVSMVLVVLDKRADAHDK
jgi:MFS family permease